MKKKEKICLSSAILQIPIESFFRTPSCCGNQSRSTTPKFGDCKPNKTNSDKPPFKQLHSSTRVPFTPQKNKIASYIFSDKKTNEQIDESQMDLARAVYGTGCSLRVFENKLWIDSFVKLRPAFKLPNRDLLSNSLLERVYNETSITLKNLNEGIINFVVTVPQPIFWTSIETGAESHTGEYMANIVKKIICDVGPMKVLGVCTDNAANMKKAWQLIVTEFPHIYLYGCLAHTLNLIFTDASNLKSIADSQRNCTMVVKGIKNSQILSALLKQHQQKSGQIIQQSLKLPVTTRWASIIHCIKSLHNIRLALRGLAIDDEAKSLAKPIQNLLLSEVFWDKVDRFIKLLKPIAIAIAAVEGDKLSLSIVAQTFSDLKSLFRTISFAVQF
ncbi:uncharacterized protein LOC136074050 [Hydra vulgaris]|uniref:Uncharacterized protein LOC136074050 n=1 Tax=Hydra vulgaris TaxID=6087 RepID=A0ABM4B0X0_HYDVU